MMPGWRRGMRGTHRRTDLRRSTRRPRAPCELRPWAGSPRLQQKGRTKLQRPRTPAQRRHHHPRGWTDVTMHQGNPVSRVKRAGDPDWGLFPQRLAIASKGLVSLGFLNCPTHEVQAFPALQIFTTQPGGSCSARSGACSAMAVGVHCCPAQKWSPQGGKSVYLPPHPRPP